MTNDISVTRKIVSSAVVIGYVFLFRYVVAILALQVPTSWMSSEWILFCSDTGLFVAGGVAIFTLVGPRKWVLHSEWNARIFHRKERHQTGQLSTRHIHL